MNNSVTFHSPAIHLAHSANSMTPSRFQITEFDTTLSPVGEFCTESEIASGRNVKSPETGASIDERRNRPDFRQILLESTVRFKL
jgi:hypothetical protein